ncbi:MAG: 3-deoxy-8-phosphooctulonate synthase [Nitrospirae bacterium]|nr:3-deoxy-8-phosphooctulonate synthase [Nitrospirota bacterium]
MAQTVAIGNIQTGEGQPLFVIAGPCVIENETVIMETAAALKRLGETLNIPVIFKSSYDKANRTSIDSYRGPGLIAGLKVLQQVKTQFGLPLLSDVHHPEEVDAAAEVLDILQIPAFLCRQTDLVVAAAKTGKVVNVKKGQFLSPWDMGNIVKKIEASGNNRIWLTERGASFGYNNLVTDMRAIPIMQRFGYPVIFDATHSVQLPGGQGTSSGGQREFIPTLTRAAVAAGCDGLFMEVHPNPDKALSDGPTQVPLAELEGLLRQVKAIEAAVRSTGKPS